MKATHRFILLLIPFICLSLLAHAGTAGKVKKLFKARPKPDGKLYFVRDFDCKVSDKTVKMKADYTYNYSSHYESDSIVMNFTVEQAQSIVNFQKLAIVRNADTVFSNDYIVRFYTEPEGDHWKNRHSVILSRKGFFNLFQDPAHCVIMMQYDNKRYFCRIPHKYVRAYQAIATIMSVETNYQPITTKP